MCRDCGATSYSMLWLLSLNMSYKRPLQRDSYNMCFSASIVSELRRNCINKESHIYSKWALSCWFSNAYSHKCKNHVLTWNFARNAYLRVQAESRYFIFLLSHYASLCRKCQDLWYSANGITLSGARGACWLISSMPGCPKRLSQLLSKRTGHGVII